jgi:hypothetical protein
MESKLYLTTAILSSILAFALIAGIPGAFVSVLAQGEGGGTGGTPGGEGMTGGGGMSEGLGNETGGMTEGQTDPNGEGEVDLGTGGP